MRVLQFCLKPPFPNKDGGCLAINQMTRALDKAGISVKVMAICTAKHPYVPEAYPPGYLEKYGFETLFVDTSLNVVDAFSALLTQDSYNISRFFSPDVDKALEELLMAETYDVIILESLFVASYMHTIRRITQAPVVLRSHNLEFTIWHRLAKLQKSGIKKTYLRILTRQLKIYETDVLKEIDGLIAINPDELAHFRRLGYPGKGITVPFGVDTRDYIPDHEHMEFPSVFHLGSMDWQPNQEGLKWYLDKVWPLILTERPDLKMYIAGREMPEWVDEYATENVIIIGDVPDAKNFMRSKGVLVIPLLSGGGMRVKMIEALALEKAIVSTPLGARGVKIKNGKDAILARSAADFARSVIKLTDDLQATLEMGKAGRHLVEFTYHNDILSAQTAEYLRKLIK